MSSDSAINVRAVSKSFQIYDAPQNRLKQFIFPKLQKLSGAQTKSYFREFRAVNNVTFDVKRGETVGIIGKNGSGKSTLLQMICGTLTPSSGMIETSGRIAALLELGSGFNPEFSGRENVYMNASLLGLERREIDAKFDDIVAFADIGSFINEPVKTYSSGMVVRLAFAVQSQVDPDILIVDEALAVGDAKFQLKCFDRLTKLKNQGTSILLVTHSGEQIVTHCDKAILLNNGEIIEQGTPKSVNNRYLDLLFGKEKSEDARNSATPIKHGPISGADRIDERQHPSLEEELYASRTNFNPHEYRWGDGKATILDFLLRTSEEDYPSCIHTGQTIELIVSIRWLKQITCPIFGITLKTREGITVYGANSETLDLNELRDCGNEGQTTIVKASFACHLASGDYFISTGIASRQGDEIIPHDRRYDSIHFQVRSNQAFSGLVDLNMQMLTEN
jgi:lipopolysaccharide transport system ATP-binding protein